MEIEEHLHIVLDEVMKLEERLRERAATPNRRPLGRDEMALGTVLGGRFVTPLGAEHLTKAAEILLHREGLQVRLSLGSARDILDEELKQEIEKLRATNDFSFEEAVERAADRMHSGCQLTGNCFFPAFIGSRGEEIDIRLGAARIMSRDVFERDFEAHIPRLDPTTSNLFRFGADLSENWRQLYDDYPYIISVQFKEYEEKMVEGAARSVAEFLLNLIRIMLPHHQALRVRLSGERRPETQTAFLGVSDDGTTFGKSSQGVEGAIIPDNWPDEFLYNISPAKHMITTIIDQLISGKPLNFPVIQRVHFADQLIMEAYQDPSPIMAIVKLVSALEALAVLTSKDKKKATLELRCALAGGGGNSDTVRSIRQAIGNAYRARNEIVHGDAPEHDAAINAMNELHAHILEIVLNLWGVLISIDNVHRPNDAKALAKRVEVFFDTEQTECEAIWKGLGVTNPLAGS